jgi:hypothetical protein
MESTRLFNCERWAKEKVRGTDREFAVFSAAEHGPMISVKDLWTIILERA